MDQTENGCLETYLNHRSSFLSVGLYFSIRRDNGDFSKFEILANTTKFVSFNYEILVHFKEKCTLF